MTPDELDLERLPPEDVATRAVDRLDLQLKRELARWVIRCGLGPAFARQRSDVDLSPDELGALLAISFDGRDDPLHDDLYRQLTEWYRDDEPEILPSGCPRCGCEWWHVTVRWEAGGPVDHSTPVECSECGYEPEPGSDEYSIAWGSGAQGDVDDPAPARGARRCDECDEWTSEYSDECSRCGGDPYADSRGDAE